MLKIITYYWVNAAAPPGFRLGGNILGGRPSRGSGGRSPQDAGEFSKILKGFLRKLQYKCIILAYFSKKVHEPCVNISQIWTENTIVWETFEKILKMSIRK